MNKEILKINSTILIIIGVSIMLFATILMACLILLPISLLFKYFVVIGTIIVYVLSSPLVISGKCTMSYLNGKKIYILCMIFSFIGIILSGLFIFEFIYVDTFNIFTDYYSGDINTGLKNIISTIIFSVAIYPFIIHIILLYKEKNNLKYKQIWKYYVFLVIGIILIIVISIVYNLSKTNNINININKIEVTEDNTYIYSDFESELENRGLIYELPENKSELTSIQKITALDSNYKYAYTFSAGSHRVTKFPIFIYSSYTSLIKKSDETDDDYYIGPEDWYIDWYIYYINGNIYAAIGEESEYGSGWETSLSTTEYGVIISEEEEITIYNQENNYFAKGGGILDTESETTRYSFPTTTDIYNEDCMDIRVVDTVDAQTLDEIANELSPEYWKVYKNND